MQKLANEAAGAAKDAARRSEKAAQHAQTAAEHIKTASPVGDPDRLGVGIAVALLVAAAIVVVSGATTGPQFEPDKDFQLFAGFFVVAQAVERLVELSRGLLPSLLPAEDPTEKANVTVITSAMALLLGIVASAGLGLYFLDAVAVEQVPKRVDVLVSGLLIAGGTAGLHELISRIEKSKHAAIANAAASSAAAATHTAGAAAQAEQVASKAATAARKASDAAMRAITPEEEAERESGGEGAAPPSG